MRVGIDVSILSSTLTGIGRFTLSLVRALAGAEPSLEWVLLGAPKPPEELRDSSSPAAPQNDSGGGFCGSVSDKLSQAPNVTIHRVRSLAGARRVIWQQVALPRLARRYHVDVLHCPDFSRPIHVSVPVVNTIHDLSYYSRHSFFGLGGRTYKRCLTHIAVKKSARIVADSKFTRDELARRFDLDPGKIAVIYLGADSDALASEGESRAPHSGDDTSPLEKSGDAKLALSDGQRPPLQNPNPFVLYVGTLEERKNLLNLIQGFALMRAQNRLPHRLVLAGKPGRGFDKIQAAVSASPYAEDIEVLGYVDGERLRELYGSADAVAMPSVYEGFGLPVLEAMAMGTPVVCSRAASLPEVGGDAVEYFDPLSPEDMAGALARVLESETVRAEMRRKGLKRARQFTWDECARRYLEVYKAAAAGK